MRSGQVRAFDVGEVCDHMFFEFEKTLNVGAVCDRSVHALIERTCIARCPVRWRSYLEDSWTRVLLPFSIRPEVRKALADASSFRYASQKAIVLVLT